MRCAPVVVRHCHCRCRTCFAHSPACSLQLSTSTFQPSNPTPPDPTPHYPHYYPLYPALSRSSVPHLLACILVPDSPQFGSRFPFSRIRSSPPSPLVVLRSHLLIIYVVKHAVHRNRLLRTVSRNRADPVLSVRLSCVLESTELHRLHCATSIVVASVAKTSMHCCGIVVGNRTRVQHDRETWLEMN